jgi:hypothetical protein
MPASETPPATPPPTARCTPTTPHTPPPGDWSTPPSHPQVRPPLQTRKLVTTAERTVLYSACLRSKHPADPADPHAEAATLAISPDEARCVLTGAVFSPGHEPRLVVEHAHDDRNPGTSAVRGLTTYKVNGAEGRARARVLNESGCGRRAYFPRSQWTKHMRIRHAELFAREVNRGADRDAIFVGLPLGVGRTTTARCYWYLYLRPRYTAPCAAGADARGVPAARAGRT